MWPQIAKSIVRGNGLELSRIAKPNNDQNQEKVGDDGMEMACNPLARSRLRCSGTKSTAPGVLIGPDGASHQT